MRHVPTPRPRAAPRLALVVLLLVPFSVGVGMPGVPGPVPAEASTSVTPMLSSFGGHTCMLLEDSTVRCWGVNARGQLGDGTTTFRTMPVTVVLSEAEGGGPLTGVIAISAGTDHTCALVHDGTVRCWGWNVQGQLGIGTAGPETDSAHPVPVVRSVAEGGGQLTGVTAIAAGAGHTCALIDDETVRCWGNNGSGQLGDGSTTRRTNPVTVLASGTADSSPVDLTAVTAISAGVWHTCALMTDATVRCWGSNENGQLGDGTSDAFKPNPVAVVGGGMGKREPGGAEHLGGWPAHVRDGLRRRCSERRSLLGCERRRAARQRDDHRLLREEPDTDGGVRERHLGHRVGGHRGRDRDRAHVRADGRRRCAVLGCERRRVQPVRATR